MKFLKKALSVLLCAGFITGLALSMIGCKQEIEPEEPKEYLPVSDLTVTAGYKQVTLNWTNPEDDELSSIEIKYGKSANNLSEKATCDASENKYSITGLENETKYYFTVYTIYSDSKSTKKASGTKNAETIKPEAVKGLKTEVTGTSTIKLSWTNQEGDFYKAKKINYGTDSSKLDKTIEIKDNTTTSAEVKELSQDTKYYFQVTTVLSDDATVSSSKVNATTEKEKTEDTPPTEDNPPAENNPPANTKTYAAVSGLTSTAGYKQISLSWTNPTDTELSGLTVNYGTDSSNLSGTKTLAATVNSCSLTDLANNTKYYFTVTAVYSDTNATKKTSSVLNATTVNPVGVSGVSCQNYTSNSITIRWTNQTGDFYTSRKVIYGTSESNLNNEITINDNTTTSARIADLTPSTTYYIQVVTILSDNQTVASSVVNKATKAPSSSESSVEFAKKLTIGWNLGNTLDAPSETGWGMPTTTQEMIQAVAAAGYKTIRIPVSWSKHVSGANYTIDSTWMDRVKQIVDWSLGAGMYVILNVHHDNYFAGATFTKNGEEIPGLADANVYGFAIALNDNDGLQTKSKNYLQKVWTQIATEFASYENNLIFEVLNEPRAYGSSYEWYIPDTDTAKPYCDVIKSYEETCISAIRAVEGNEDRFLMVPGYAASGSNQTFLGAYTMPDNDTASDKLLLSAHAYDPSDFAMTGTDYTYEDSDEGTQLTSIFDYLKTNFTDNGVGVVMGEASCTNKDNLAERLKWFEAYHQKAKAAGIPVVLWDNMSATPDGTLENGERKGTNGEHHGYFNRKTLSWYFPTLIAKSMDVVGVTGYTIPEYVAPTLSSIGWNDTATTNIVTSAGNLSWGTSSNILSKSNFSNAKAGSILKICFETSGASIKIINGSWTTHSTGTIINGESDSDGVISAESTELYYVLTASDATDFKASNIYIAGTNGTITAVYFQE